MTDLDTLIRALGPAGAILAVCYSVFRAAWPYLRDTYLPGRLKALEKTATAMESIAALANRLDLRLASVELRLVDVQEDVSAIGTDVSTLFGAIGAEQPSRGRRKSPKLDLTSTGAAS